MQITKNINPAIFREYDIRGVFGVDLNEDVAYTIGRSFGSYIREKGEEKTVIGHDNRLSSPILTKGILKGITDSGVSVVDLGLVTTPMYYYARKHLSIKTGIMITASHNPKDDNGFKIAFSEIGNAYGEFIYSFRDYTLEGKFLKGTGVMETYDIKPAYLQLLKKSIDLGNRPLRVVVDCGNGTGSVVMEEVLKEFPVEYDLLYCESDGTFPNHLADPAVPENQKALCERVKELGYDFGFSIDGDADRVGVVDEKGQIWATDIYMLVMYRFLNSHLKTRKALFDVKCSKTLIDGLKELEIEPVMYRTGNSYTNMMMQQGDFDFGGEYSGHVFFRDKFPGFDDGIYGGLRMLELLSHYDRPMSTLLEGMSVYISTPELKFPMSDETKFAVVEKIKEYAMQQQYQITTIDGVRVLFEDGWALVRVSNTGPNITARFEATSKERLEEIQKEFTSLIEQYGTSANS